MKTRALVVIVTLAAVTAFLLPVAALADLTVKEAMEMNGMMGMVSSKGTETTYIKGAKMRVESEMEMGGMLAGMAKGAEADTPGDQVTIMRPDKGVIWFVDNEESTYAEVSLKAGSADSLRNSGVKVKEIKVTDTGKTKEIIGYKCKGVEVDMTIEVAMGEGEERTVQTQNVKSLFWMRPEVKDLEELRSFWDRMVELARTSQQDDATGGAMNAVFAKVKEIDGVPLGVEMTMENLMGGAAADEEQQAEMKEAMAMMRKMMKGKGEAPKEEPAADEGAGLKITRYVTAISKGGLGDGLFEVPTGYSKTVGLEEE
jgi:hypothetical protein